MKPMAKASIKSKSKSSNLRVFEEAREALAKLVSLSRALTPSQLETLEILLDKRAPALIAKSMSEIERGKLQPIAKIL
jgi:hypothetical protein